MGVWVERLRGDVKNMRFWWSPNVRRDDAAGIVPELTFGLHHLNGEGGEGRGPICKKGYFAV